MFFPELIRSIKSTDRVLEIGPGSMPHRRADIFLEKRFDNEEVAFVQRGFAQATKIKKQLVYYDGGKFPFKDKEFDYVICSHVIEHVPKEELDLMFSELQRVARRGYIEFPTVFYELINYQDVHIWLMNYRNGTILFMEKSYFKSNYVHKIYREIFYGADKYMYDAFQRYRELFFCGLEWETRIDYKVVSAYDDLVNEEDYMKWKTYFSDFKIKRISHPKARDYIQSSRKLVGAVFTLIRQLNQLICDANKPKYFVHKTAQLDKKKLITVRAHAEIQDHVIIRTYSNPVVIGQYTQINPFTVIYGGSGVYIGNNVMIAPHCMIAAGDHDFKQTDKPIRFAANLSKGPIIIEDNVWIAANCTITDGVRIGRDAVIAANSVVIQDVEPYDIVGGVPAKVIGNRKQNEKKP